MEKPDYRQLSLKETGIYSSDYAFYPHLKKSNITTLGQLFDNELMFKAMEHCSINTRSQLRGYISILKYKYLGVPLINDRYLEFTATKFDTRHCTLSLPYYMPEYFFNNVNFNGMGFNKRAHHKIMLAFATELGSRMNGMKLIDFFKLLIEHTTDCSMKKSIEAYIDSYEKRKTKSSKTDGNISSRNETSITTFSEHTTSQELDTIINLKEKLNDLISIRDGLDSQIASLQQKIEFLTLHQANGNVKK